jgi:hypothetical protein
MRTILRTLVLSSAAWLVVAPASAAMIHGGGGGGGFHGGGGFGGFHGGGFGGGAFHAGAFHGGVFHDGAVHLGGTTSPGFHTGASFRGFHSMVVMNGGAGGLHASRDGRFRGFAGGPFDRRNFIHRHFRFVGGPGDWGGYGYGCNAPYWDGYAYYSYGGACAYGPYSGDYSGPLIQEY